MVWLVGIVFGFLLPWIIRRNALWHAFTFFGVKSGLALWSLMSIVTIPVGTIVAVLVAEIVGIA